MLFIHCTIHLQSVKIISNSNRNRYIKRLKRTTLIKVLLYIRFAKMIGAIKLPKPACPYSR